jgi:hypothetical protein
MQKNISNARERLLEGFPWFRCDGCYPISAYSEFMPPPMPCHKPYGRPDNSVLSPDDPFGWKITEMEEEYELKPGIWHIGLQIMSNIIKLGRNLPAHQIGGHGDENLKDNPYWPPELADKAGFLYHEKYVALLPLMLSRTQDDKGRVLWTFFGNSVHDPEYAFWKSFFSSPGVEITGGESFFTDLLSEAYNEKLTDPESLYTSGFRILPSDLSLLPLWTRRFLFKDDLSPAGIKYLLTFRPFETLPAAVKNRYLSGELALLPFPGSLVFWGMPGYSKLKKQCPVTGQIPLQNLVARNRGINSLRVTQSGWFHEFHPGSNELVINENLLQDTFHRTHRWQRIQRYQDELNEVAHRIKMIKALFSTEPDSMGLYNKPMACNSQIWNNRFELLLNGPRADRIKIREVEKTISEGGLFGYRFFFPPMRVGKHEIYLHRPLVAFEDERTGKIVIKSQSLTGVITGYKNDEISDPAELWPRILRREPHLSALHDFESESDYYSHQTSLNLISLFESSEKQNRKPLRRTFAHHILNISKQKSLEEWIRELDNHTVSGEKASAMRSYLDKIIEPDYSDSLPEPLTFADTACRLFEEAWWSDIRFLAHSEFIYTDNADIMQDETTLEQVRKKQRDIEYLGDYLIARHQRAIKNAGMEGKAIVGEQPFRWSTLFDFTEFGGWIGNQEGRNHERNIILVIPGKNRNRAVIFADHYDTAYMEDIYEKERGGTGARLAADGADDNYSATATLLQAAPVFLNLSREGKLERDIWIVHLTGEEFPSDCMGARNLCQRLVEGNLLLKTEGQYETDLSETEVIGVYVMDMIGHNRDNDLDIFQISPGKSAASLNLARQAHISNMIWNATAQRLNLQPGRLHKSRGKRITGSIQIPETAKHLLLKGEVRTQYNPHSSIFNTDGQIFSDAGVPVVLFMENYDINRSGYHDTKDTLENIDLDYGAALAAIAIETVARMATMPDINS